MPGTVLIILPVFIVAAISEELGWSPFATEKLVSKVSILAAGLIVGIVWAELLTGHSQSTLESELAQRTSFEDFFAQASQIKPSRTLITGVVCGVRVQDVEEPTMREIRYLDKLVEELAKGRAMEKILRQ